MGYTTTFEGKLKLNKQLDKESCEEIEKLNNYDPDEDPNPTFPESYCKWVVDDDKKHIVWNKEEKFYFFVEWLEYIIKHILKPKDYILSGELIADGDEDDDFGKIIVKNNNVLYKKTFGKELDDHIKQRKKEYEESFPYSEYVGEKETKEKESYLFWHNLFNRLFQIIMIVIACAGIIFLCMYVIDFIINYEPPDVQKITQSNPF